MTYYHISIGFNHFRYNDNFSCVETTKEEYDKFLKYNYREHMYITSDLR